MAVCLFASPTSFCAQFARICVYVYYRSWSGALVVWRCIHWSWTARAFFPSWVRWPRATEPAANMLHAVFLPPSFFECLCVCACRLSRVYVFACVFVCVFVYVLLSGFADHKPASQPPSCCMLDPLSLCAPMCLISHFSVCWCFRVCRGICIFCACVFVYLRGFADRWSAKNMLHARSLNTARCFAFPFPRHIFPNIPQPEIEDLPEPPEPLSPKLTDPNASTAWLSKSLN